MNNEEIRKAYLYAIEKGVSQGFIAENAGLPIASLRKYKESGVLGSERKRILLQWLEKEGYMAAAKNSDPLLVIANELRNLAEVLESDLKRETKEKRLVAFLDAYTPERARAAEEPGKYGT